MGSHPTFACCFGALASFGVLWLPLLSGACLCQNFTSSSLVARWTYEFFWYRVSCHPQGLKKACDLTSLAVATQLSLNAASQVACSNPQGALDCNFSAGPKMHS